MAQVCSSIHIYRVVGQEPQTVSAELRIIVAVKTCIRRIREE